MHIGWEKIEVSRLRHIDERILEQLFAVDIDELIGLGIGVSRREPAKRFREHRVAGGVVVMPRHLARLLPPPRLEVVPYPSINKTAAVDVAGCRQVLFSAAKVPGYEALSSRLTTIVGAPESTAPAELSAASSE